MRMHEYIKLLDALSDMIEEDDWENSKEYLKTLDVARNALRYTILKG